MKVLVIHGPNLNMLGLRETGIYGTVTLAQINERLKELAASLNIQLDIIQSNSEAVLIDTIQKGTKDGACGVLINPAAYGHTSIALRDALIAVSVPFVEVHISNTFAREAYRHQTYLSDIASGVVIGFGEESYLLGLRGLVAQLSRK